MPPQRASDRVWCRALSNAATEVSPTACSPKIMWNKARKPLNDGVLTFPFFTIENVDRVDDTHIIVGNDNNLPFSSSREPNKADDDEFVLLEVGGFLKAK